MARKRKRGSGITKKRQRSATPSAQGLVNVSEQASNLSLSSTLDQSNNISCVGEGDGEGGTQDPKWWIKRAKMGVIATKFVVLPSNVTNKELLAKKGRDGIRYTREVTGITPIFDSITVVVDRTICPNLRLGTTTHLPPINTIQAIVLNNLITPEVLRGLNRHKDEILRKSGTNRCTGAKRGNFKSLHLCIWKRKSDIPFESSDLTQFLAGREFLAANSLLFEMVSDICFKGGALNLGEIGYRVNGQAGSLFGFRSALITHYNDPFAGTRDSLVFMTCGEMYGWMLKGLEKDISRRHIFARAKLFDV
ncbi:hypothetical protein BC829DRAFT_436122 [Chytridium lagenaria]|nr:hypothetical protein BC829DRAFT_436122 [Chytridium lagenaria]